MDQISSPFCQPKRSKLCCWPCALVRAVAGRGAPALPRRVPERDIPILRPAVAVEVEPVAFVIVVATPGFLPAIVPAIVAPLFAALLAPVVAVRVPRAAFLAVARNLSVFQVWVSHAPLLVGPVFLLFHPVFDCKVSKHFLEPLARHFDIAKGPDRRQEFPVMMLVNDGDQAVRFSSDLPELGLQAGKVGIAFGAQALQEESKVPNFFAQNFSPFFRSGHPLLGVHDALHVRLERPKD
jgi:hypothetical protein